MNTNHPDQNRLFRSRRARRVAAVTGALALALGAGAWAGGGSPDTASTSSASPATPAAAARVIGNGVDSYAPVVDAVAPAVVTVRSERRSRLTSQTLPPMLQDPWFRDFFGFGERFAVPQPPPVERGLGSGVIVRSDGYILTNHHVIDGAERVTIELSDRRVFDARVVGSDPPTDLAVLKIDGAENLPVVPFGDSEKVQVGDIVLALGNPMGVGQTVTMGIISAKGRATGLGDGSYEDFLQTDAPINRGNSGGALVNTRGELVGINSQILSPSGGNIGIGFAIPVNMARNVMEALIEHGAVRRGRLGVTIQPITADLAESLGLEQIAGALVSDVEEDSPAAKAGLERGDVIVAINGQAVASSNDLRNRIAQAGPGATVELTFIRDGRRQTTTATLAELPSQTARARGDVPGEDRTAGLVVEPLTPERARELGIEEGTGLLVTRVSPTGAAAEAGFRPGDVIREIDGAPVDSVSDLRNALAGGERPALVLVKRGDQHLFLSLRRG